MSFLLRVIPSRPLSCLYCRTFSTSLTSSNSSGRRFNDDPVITSDGRDFYDVLGISPDATTTEIREAFYRLNKA